MSHCYVTVVVPRKITSLLLLHVIFYVFSRFINLESFGLIMGHLPPLRILNSASRAKCICDDKKRAWIVRYGQRNGALGENRDDVCRLKCHSQELAGLDIRYNVTLTIAKGWIHAFPALRYATIYAFQFICDI